MTPREKKAKQRAAKRKDGYVEISVWIAPEHVETVREFAASLSKPQKPFSGPSLFDCLDAEPDFAETSNIGEKSGSSLT